MREAETAEGRCLDAVTTLKRISWSRCSVGDWKGVPTRQKLRFLVTYFKAKFNFINCHHESMGWKHAGEAPTWKGRVLMR